MKKLLAITGCILISCIIISYYAGGTSPEAMENKGFLFSDTPSVQNTQPTNDGYIVSVFAGRVALYRKSDEKVLFTTDTLVRDLPIEDQKILQQGIEVATRKEADDLLKEYSS